MLIHVRIAHRANFLVFEYPQKKRRKGIQVPTTADDPISTCALRAMRSTSFVFYFLLTNCAQAGARKSAAEAFSRCDLATYDQRPPKHLKQRVRLVDSHGTFVRQGRIDSVQQIFRVDQMDRGESRFGCYARRGNGDRRRSWCVLLSKRKFVKERFRKARKEGKLG